VVGDDGVAPGIDVVIDVDDVVHQRVDRQSGEADASLRWFDIVVRRAIARAWQEQILDVLRGDCHHAGRPDVCRSPAVIDFIRFQRPSAEA
jgi:hypothetical protein